MSAPSVLPAFASTENQDLQQEIDRLGQRVTNAENNLQNEEQRENALGDSLRQLELQMRQQQSQAEAQRAEIDTEAHLKRMLLQSDVSAPIRVGRLIN